MRASILVGALLVVGGAAAAVFATTQATPAVDQTPTFDRGVTAVDAQLRVAQSALEARATTLADGPGLRSGIGADAATLMDQAGREINVEPGKKEEVIELGQRVGEKVTSLLRRPETAGASPFLGQAGFHLAVLEGHLVATKVVEVKPAYLPPDAPPDLLGVIAVSWRVDLGNEAELFAAAQMPARLDTGDGSVVLGQAPAAAPTPSSARWRRSRR
ncbi:MAG: hypothetical protein R2939_13490 [Kofleriaceae bacterium]